MNPQSKKYEKSHSKRKQKNGLNTNKATSLSNFNGTIVKCTLVWVLFYLINHVPHKIKCSSLTQKRITVSAGAQAQAKDLLVSKSSKKH